MELEEHLAGFASYGVYVIDPEMQYLDGLTQAVVPVQHTVKYVLFDLDTYTESSFEKLKRCCEAFASFVRLGAGMHDPDVFKCLLAENSGGKGYHVWLFLDRPLPAAQVRAWVRDGFMPLWEEAIGKFTSMHPLEIFPKQDTVDEGGFGNLVKLPLGVHAKAGNKSYFVGVQGWAESVDSVQELDADLVPAYTPPAPHEVEAGGGLRTEDDLTPFACVSKVLREGAPSGCRDNAMFHLAAYAKGTGLPEDLVLEWCERANQMFDPPLRDREVRTKVKSAFKGNAPQASCKADWLEGFCPGGEHCFAPRTEDRPRTGYHEDDEATSYLRMSPEDRREYRRQRRES
jgi:hypothetical protein